MASNKATDKKPVKKTNSNAMEASAVSELEKLLYFDDLFRHKLSVYGNTVQVIADHVRQYNEEHGTNYPCGKNSLLVIKEKLYGYGAHFKEEKGGPTGRATLYEYIDPKQTLRGLEKAIGRALKARSEEIVKLLDRKEDATPHEVWAKHFLAHLFDQGKTCIDHISFDENINLAGIKEYFEILLKHILEKKPIEIDYHPFNEKPRKVHMHPYYLKMYNSRWYVIGRIRNRHMEGVTYYKTLTNIALDRIVPGKDGIAIRPWEGVEFLENNVDFNRFYQQMVGVSDTGSPKDVILRFDKSRYNYIRTNPWVSNQTELKPGDQYYCQDRPTIKIRVKLNTELTQRILSFGKDVEVIAPYSLRRTIAQETRAMRGLYN